MIKDSSISISGDPLQLVISSDEPGKCRVRIDETMTTVDLADIIAIAEILQQTKTRRRTRPYIRQDE
jgi:hypothetical protein